MGTPRQPRSDKTNARFAHRKVVERDVECALVDNVRAAGGEAYKFVSPGRIGVPDRIVILPGKRPVFVELKSETGRLSAAQLRECQRLEALGQRVRIVSSIKEALSFAEKLTP